MLLYAHFLTAVAVGIFVRTRLLFFLLIAFVVSALPSLFVVLFFVAAVNVSWVFFVFGYFRLWNCCLIWPYAWKEERVSSQLGCIALSPL